MSGVKHIYSLTMRSILLIVAMIAGTLYGYGQSVLSTGRWWDIAVTDEGVYSIGSSDIPDLIGVNINSISIYGASGEQLSLNNAQVSVDDIKPICIDIIDHNGNGIFDQSDAILFFGEGVDLWRYSPTSDRWVFAHHAYATRNHYFLTIDAQEQRRISHAAPVAYSDDITTYTAVAHVDNDLVNMLHTGQRWMGEHFSSNIPSRTFTLQMPQAAGDNATISYAVAHKSNATSIFSISGGSYHGSASLGSGTDYASYIESTVLGGGTTTFTVNYSSADGAGVGYLDYIEVNLPASIRFTSGQAIFRISPTVEAAHFNMTGTARVWEVSTAGAEREMTINNGSWTDSLPAARKYIAFDGSHYLSPASIASLANQDLHGAEAADMVIVANPSLLSQGQRLGTLHELFDGLHTLVVTDKQVFNEYSSGKPDPMAIRSLMRSLKSKHPERPPRYLLLLGKGTYDNRNLMGNNQTTVVTYETLNSTSNADSSYCCDDILGCLGANASGRPSETLDVSVGRLPAANLAQATQMVDKIEGYITLRDLADDNARGDWRNYVALLADDADPGSPSDSGFAHSSEVVAKTINSNYPQLNIDKLYADAYRQSSGAIGSYYPDLNNALRQRINNGCLLLNYIGHGSTTYIGTERYIEFSDIDRYTNTDRLPLFVTSTCSYGRFDQVDDICGAEACLLAPAATIAVISASRPIHHIESFNNDVVRYALDPNYTIGDALRLAKNNTNYEEPGIGLTGDPALRLSQPSNRVVVTAINNRPVSEELTDSAEVLSRVTIEGEIRDADGNLVSDFDGTIFPIVFDRPTTTYTLANNNPGTEVRFTQQNTILYRGNHTVNGGRFQYTFVVPRDVAYQYGRARLSHYARSTADHASGSYSNLLLGGFNEQSELTECSPTIVLYMGDTNFLPGGITSTTATLIAHLTDSAGINAGAGLGHDITATIDNNPGSLVVLNDFYEPYSHNTHGGSVRYTFSELTPGPHTITLKAWNILGQSSSATINFIVYNPDTLTLSDLRCYPNPATDYMRFTLEANNTTRITTAILNIYNQQGQLIATCQPPVSADGFTIGPSIWNLSGVAPGIYMARIIITDSEGEIHQRTTKCIVH